VGAAVGAAVGNLVGDAEGNAVGRGLFAAVIHPGGAAAFGTNPASDIEIAVANVFGGGPLVIRIHGRRPCRLVPYARRGMRSTFQRGSYTTGIAHRNGLWGTTKMCLHRGTCRRLSLGGVGMVVPSFPLIFACQTIRAQGERSVVNSVSWCGCGTSTAALRSVSAHTSVV